MSTAIEGMSDGDVRWGAYGIALGNLSASDLGASHLEQCYIDSAPDLACSINDFVEFVLKEKGPFVTQRLGPERLEYKPRVLSFLKMLPEMIAVARYFPKGYDFDEYLTSFRRVCESEGLFEMGPVWPPFSQQRLNYGVGDPAATWRVILINKLADAIRQDCSKFDVVAKNRARVRDAEERLVCYRDYVLRVFDFYKRLVVLRIDLFYREGLSEQIEFDDIRSDVDRFLKGRRHNSIFYAMAGYVLKFEFGFKKGFHAHLILMFDGDLRDGRRHVYLAKQIGDYWVKNVTKGRGAFWNCNAQFNDYKKMGVCGIGLITRDDVNRLSNLTDRVLRYLCKSVQYARPQGVTDSKVIRRGLLSKQKKKTPQKICPRRSRRAWDKTMKNLS